MKTSQRTRTAGFTLIELLIVMVIIGLLMGFILVVSFAGIEQARVRATQALITKLELGLNERLNALLSTSVSPNGGHRFLAAAATFPDLPPGVAPETLPWGLPSDQRAQVIARIDQIKREIPDVFFIQSPADFPRYPVNFAATPYGPALGNTLPDAQWELPIGHRHPLFKPNQPGAGGIGDANPGYPEGVFGASHAARASLYKLIGLNPKGYNGADDDLPGAPGYGYVDDFAEATDYGNDTDALSNWQRFVANHRHDTARSEMLYALLVEGQGPLGAVFSPEDFTPEEVKDTDGDGLPEFVDGWGRPLQFFRWPVFFQSDGIQKGATPYFGLVEPRERSPLDPNNHLTAPAWWQAQGGFAPAPSPKAIAFQSLFTCIIEPNRDPSPPFGTRWDPSGNTGRRAFYCRFLIVSGGPDRQTGLNQRTQAEADAAKESASDALSFAEYLVWGQSIGNHDRPAENYAAWNNNDQLETWNPNLPYVPDFRPDVALDNIDNLGLQSQAGGTR